MCVLVETKEREREGDLPPLARFPHLVSVITLNELNQLGDKGTNHFFSRVVDSINPYILPLSPSIYQNISSNKQLT